VDSTYYKNDETGEILNTRNPRIIKKGAVIPPHA